MSGSTIGGFAGGLIGFVFGGPAGAQLGFVIGSAVGGAVDPQKIEGPRLTDAQSQTSSEGVPRSIVYGTAGVAGNLIQSGPLIEHKKKERASKGGPVTTTYSYTRTVAIRICEAAPLGGTMRLRRVWKDDKLVYDTSATGKISADSAAFASILTFYSGDEDQLPDPSLEALPAENGGGVGNVPAYRGTCYAVLTDLDCTDRQGAVSQFRWEVCSDATEELVSTSRYVAVDYARFTNNPNDPFTHPMTPAYYDILSATGSKITGAGFTTSAVDTIQDCLDYAEAVGAYPAWGSPDYYVGIMRGGSGPYSPSNSDAMVGHGGPFRDMTKYREAWLMYSWAQPVAYQDNVRTVGDNFGTRAPTGGVWTSDCAGQVFRSYTSHDPTTGNYSGNFEGFSSLVINIRAKRIVPVDQPTADEFYLPDKPGYVSDTLGNVRKLGGAATLQSGLFRTLSIESSDTTYNPRELGPVRVRGSVDDTKAKWDADYAAAVAAGDLPAGYTYSATGTSGVNTYPRNTGGAYQITSGAVTVVTPGKVSLPAVVLDLCDRVGIGADQVDVSALAGKEVRGFPVSRQTTPAAAIRSLQQVFFYDIPEWGNSGDTTSKLRAVLRGGPVRVTISEDDITEDGGENDNIRPQPVEFPRKLSVTAPDPDANYEPATQPAEIDTENVQAVGEVSISTAVVMTRDELAVVAGRLLKMQVDQATGKRTLELPDKFSQYTPSDNIIYQGRRLRIDRAERIDGTQKWEVIRDSVGSSVSEAVGSPAPTPSPAVSSVRGPTMFGAWNLPRLRSGDSSPGMYVGVCGILPGWIGCDLYMSVDGGVSEQLVATIVDAATMGKLAANLTATGSPLSVSMFDGELDSVTAEQLISRMNSAAVTTAGTSEILQFQTTTETAEKAYDLTDLSRGVLGTVGAQHYAGDSFILLDSAVQLLPLDISLAGRTLIFRPVSIGTVPANNDTYSVVFMPKFTSAFTADPYVDELGSVYVDENGSPYYSSEV